MTLDERVEKQIGSLVLMVLKQQHELETLREAMAKAQALTNGTRVEPAERS